MRAVFGEIRGGFNSAMRPVLDDPEGDDFVVAGELPGAFPLVKAFDLDRVGDFATVEFIERVVLLPFAGAIDLGEDDLGRGDRSDLAAVADLRRRLRWTLVIAVTSSSFFIPCQPLTP